MPLEYENTCSLTLQFKTLILFKNNSLSWLSTPITSIRPPDYE